MWRAAGLANVGFTRLLLDDAMQSIDLHPDATADAKPADATPSPGAGAPDDTPAWRELALAAADIAFQADAWGRLTWLAPSNALGWDAAALIGGPGNVLLGAGAAGDGDPFRPDRPWRQRPTWLRHADGGTRCVAVSVAPILDAAGQVIGSRGLGFEMASVTQDARLLRRAAALEAMWRRIGRETAAHRMVQIALDSLVSTMGAAGAVLYAPLEQRILSRNGEATGPGIAHAAAQLLAVPEAEPGAVLTGTHLDAVLLACRIRCRPGGDVIVALWRARPARWDEGDHDVLCSAAGILRLVTEQETIQRTLAEQGRTDSVTGLATAETFVTDAMRCIERLDRDGQPGTLICAEIDDFSTLAAELGPGGGDEMLLTFAMVLQSTVRPTDLVGRLSGGIFVLWLNGADHLTAAERAEALRRGAPRVLSEVGDMGGQTLTLSQGIATRPSGSSATIEVLLERAHTARIAARAAGGGQWRVALTP